jgi:hypothetical protein
VILETACPEKPVTVMDDGYGVAAIGGVRLSLIVMRLALENVREVALDPNVENKINETGRLK